LDIRPFLSAIIFLFVFDGAVKTGDGFGFPSLRLA